MVGKSLALNLILFLLFFNSYSQHLDFHINGSSFLDNREYKAFIDRSNTIFGTRIALDGGIQLDSSNSFGLGANGIHEFGEKPFFNKADLILYYQYNTQKWLFNIGAFSRKNLLNTYPRALLNDTLNYYRPNIEGILARYNGKYGHQTVWIDWVSRQTNLNRENFLFGCSGTYRPKVQGLFYISHYFMMLHDAKANIPVPNDHIRDNGAAQVSLGLDFSHKVALLDSLTVDVGGIMSMERVRDEGNFVIPKGFVTNLYLAWKRFSFSNSFYAGEGHNIRYGDSFYTKKVYNRFDISWTPFLSKYVQGKFIFSFHQIPGQLNSNQQAFLITYDFGRRKLLKLKE